MIVGIIKSGPLRKEWLLLRGQYCAWGCECGAQFTSQTSFVAGMPIAVAYDAPEDLQLHGL